MEEKGLVYRQPDANDKRSVRIHLTEEGRRKKEFSRQTVLSFNNFVREEISDDKLSVFFDVINTINKTIENHNIYETENHKISNEKN